MAADRDKMWSEYSKQKTPQLREKLIIEYSGLVKVVAGKLSMYLGYNVEYDDLVGYGVFGLIDAIDKFDSQNNGSEEYPGTRDYNFGFCKRDEFYWEISY